MSDTGPMPDNGALRGRHRDDKGRFQAGNPGGPGRGASAPIRRLLGGVEITDAESRVVANDAARVFASTLRELPNDGPTVRQLLSLYARHVALVGYWSSKASAAGVGSPEGIEATEHATRHDLRAERLAASYLAASKALASKPADGLDLESFGKGFRK